MASLKLPKNAGKAVSQIVDLDKTEVNRVRRKAQSHGFYICKSRDRHLHSNNYGGLQLIEGYTNTVLAGVNFELDIEWADYWIDRFVAEGRGYKRSA